MPGFPRPSTSSRSLKNKDVDARDKPGHDAESCPPTDHRRFPLPFCMIYIMSYSPGAAMADETVSTIAAAPRPEVSSTFAEITVLAALAATGTLATNILLPSLPQIAMSPNVSSAAVTSAITVFLAALPLGQLMVGPISDRYGPRWPVLIGFLVFIAGTIWCSLSPHLPIPLAVRVS